MKHLQDIKDDLERVLKTLGENNLQGVLETLVGAAEKLLTSLPEQSVREVNASLTLLIEAFSSKDTALMADIIRRDLIPRVNSLIQEAAAESGLYQSVDDITKDMIRQYAEHMYPDQWKGVIPPEVEKAARERRGYKMVGFYNLDYLQHLACPKIVPTAGFKVLNAGCGTGEAVVLSAVAYPRVKFTALDLNENSLARAKSYARQLNLSNIRFIHGNILDVKLEDSFDVIQSSGVIHHLSDPARGLANLQKYLKPEGLMVIMVYGEYGRHEIALFQEAIKVIQKDKLDFADGINLVNEIVNTVPPHFPIQKFEFKSDLEKGDNHMVDLLLNLNEHRYTVKTLDELVRSAGLKIIDFVTPRTYDPSSYTDSELLLDRMQKLSLVEKGRLAELLNGRIAKHMVLLSHQGREGRMPSVDDEGTQDYIPVLNPFLMQTPAANGFEVSINNEYMQEHPNVGLTTMTVNSFLMEIIRSMDGRQSFRQIYDRFKGRLPWEDFWTALCLLAQQRFIYLHLAP